MGGPQSCALGGRSRPLAYLLGALLVVVKKLYGIEFACHSHSLCPFKVCNPMALVRSQPHAAFLVTPKGSPIPFGCDSPPVPSPTAVSNPSSDFCLHGVASSRHFMTLESSDPQSQVLLGVRRTRQKLHQADAVALGRGLKTPTCSSGTAWWPFMSPVSRCLLSASHVLGIVWGLGGISSEVCAVPPGLVAEADGCFGSGGWVHDRAAVPAPAVTLGLPGGEPL